MYPKSYKYQEHATKYAKARVPERKRGLTVFILNVRLSYPSYAGYSKLQTTIRGVLLLPIELDYTSITTTIH